MYKLCLEYEIRWQNTENNLAFCVETVKMLRIFNDRINNMKGYSLVHMYNVWYLVLVGCPGDVIVRGSSVSSKK